MVEIGAHSKRPGPDAEDAQTGEQPAGEQDESAGVTAGQVGGHGGGLHGVVPPGQDRAPDPGRPLSPSGRYLPDAASSEPTRSWFIPKTPAPRPPAPEPAAPHALPEPAASEAVAPETFALEAVAPEPAAPEPAAPEPAAPEAVAPEAVAPEPAAPELAAPEPPPYEMVWPASSLGAARTEDIGASVGERPNRRKLITIVGIAAALVLLVGGGGIYYLSTASKGTARAAGKTKLKRKIVTTLARGPEHVLSTSPAAGSTNVNGAGDIQVVFSEPLSRTSPMPRLRPRIRGSWHVSGDTAVFVPKKGYWQHTKVKITVPAGVTGIQSNGGGQLGAPVRATFTTGSFSEVRLEQDLAQLGYLPLTWAPTTGSPAPLTDLNAQYRAAYSPPQGNYTWQQGYPSKLISLWRPDAPSNILRGAVAAFQADHGLMLDMIAENQDGLIVTGPIGDRLWHAMFRALSRQARNQHGYTYAIANQHYPETLTVWHNGQEIFHHLANTGIPVSPTAVRTDPVYIRLQSQIMKGRNPDGSKYADQVYWVAYFHGGEAVHYFLRYSYGSQQSLGCVELPYKQAKWIWPYLTYGTLVTVTKV